MGEFFVYILKSSVCLAVLYLFYRLFLSRETFYNFNRIAILGILVLSLLLPLCEVTIKQETEVQQTVLTLEQLLLMADKFTIEESAMPVQQVSTAWWIRSILLLYLLGVVFFLFRNVYSLIQLMKLIRSSIRCKLQKGIWLISHSNPEYSPFSWMNVIVISHTDMEENNTEILIHEMAHIQKRHSIDLLITDICIIFQWFNPAVWLFKQELQNIHEYQADEAVLDHGVNAKQYQLLLIKKAAGTRLYSMANSFNHSKLKKRITMMLKRKSNPWARLKYLYILPVAAIAVTAFARPEISKELKEISAVKVNDLAGIVEIKSEEKVTQDDKKPQKPVKKKESPTVRKDSIPPPPPMHVEKTNTLSDWFMAPDSLVDGSEPLILVDNQEISNILLNAINPNAIESLSVLKDKSAISLYGKRGKNGVVLITLKKPSGAAISKKIMYGASRDREAEEKAVRARLNVVYIDGKKVTKEEFTSLPPEKINTISVEKENGDDVVYVTTTEDKGFNFNTLPSNTVVVVDGIRITADEFTSINPHAIQSIIVLKGDFNINEERRMLAKKYDALDAEGIIFITSKEKAQEEIDIKGTVRDTDGNRISGANISILDSYEGTVSDLDGNFRLNAPKDANVVVKYMNMEKAIIKAQPELNIVLKPE